MKMCAMTVLSVTLCLLVTVNSVISQPADCSILSSMIPECNCESATGSPNDIVINCRHKNLISMPLINGTYNGTIYEFTLANNLIEELPDNAFQGLKIQRVDVTDNRLRNISDVAFRGLETYLIVLKISGFVNVSAPFTAMSDLINLQELLLQTFVVPRGDLENPDFFQPFSSLLKLTLDDWGLASIGSNVFRGLTSLKELYLSKHEPLHTFPAGAIQQIKSTIEKISITETGITTLLGYGFDGLNLLKTLVLNTNKINQLETDCFLGLEDNLENLDLSFNTIPELELSRIQSLRELQILKLQNINLQTLAPNSVFLQNKPKLKELNLARNDLTNIPSNAFKNLTMLTKLELSQNFIATMADDSLNGLSSLVTLNLDSQMTTSSSLTLPSMAMLTSLTTLVLDATPLSTQSWDSIRQAHSLTILKMKQTGLETIPNEVFRMMTNLAELDLSYNQFQAINQSMFVGPRHSLKKLFLANNKIETFTRCTFNNYSSSLELDLIQNPLRCDCSLYWLRVAIQNGEILFNTNFEQCFYPTKWNGTNFISLNPSDFCTSVPQPTECDDYYTTTTTPPTTTTTLPSVVVNAVVTSNTINSITITWTIDQPQYITYVTVVHSELPVGPEASSRNLNATTPQYTISKLKSNTRYQICVVSHRVDDKLQSPVCISGMTLKSSSEPSTTTVDPSGTQMSSNQEIGIIIGSVVGGLLLFAILVAIIYLMVIRKKSPKENYPVQPRTFTRAELPTVGYDSKRYRKKKKDTTDNNKNDVGVTVISDGKTGPNIGRVSAGSYQYLQDNQNVKSQPNAGPPYVNDAAANQSFTPYENDMNLRPLPQMPQDSAGYYNPSFRNSTADDKQPHTYSEINL